MVPPVIGLVKLTALVSKLLQTTRFGTSSNVDVGLTVIVKVVGVPVQVVPPFE